MADRTTTLKLKTEGLVDAVAQAERLDKLLSRLETKANSARKRTGAASSDAALSSAENSTEAGLNRGTAAGAGRGDSRDFARQAQGLGGLVHVYATFAANVFAVSAAFNALSKAADFTIMQKAADVLSGQFGLSLNNAAKGLRDITDGAISARQSLEMVNMAATAGINTTQMEGLTQVAKGASIALGRDLTDAMNRVFKGAIKVEPELLDELGIMVKVQEASNDYARTLGKSASALTDFEKRQAFVNAVVKQGADKYSELTGQVNPYTKLLATLSDTLMTAGGGINSILEPIVKFLSTSTIGLVGTLTMIGSTLLGMAVPAIKAYGQEWQKQNKEALNGITTQLEASKKLREELLSKGTSSSRIAKNKVEAQGYQEDLGALFKNNGVFTTKAVKDNYKQFIEASGEAGLNAGIALRKRLEEQINKGQKSLEKLSSPELVGPKNLPKIEAEKARIAAITSMYESLNGYISAQQNLKLSIDKDFDANDKKSRDTIAKLEAQQRRSNAIGAVASTVSDKGVVAGFKEYIKQVGESQTKWDKFVVASKGGGALIASSLVKVASSLGTIGIVVGILATVGGALAEHFGGITDRSAKSSSAIEKLTESTKALGSSLEGLAKANSIGKIFEFNKGAVSNSIEAIKSVVDAIEKLNDLKTNGGIVERSIESAKTFFGFGDESKLGKQSAQLATNLDKAGIVSMQDLATKYGFKDTTRTVDATKDGGQIYIETTTAVEAFKKALKVDPDLMAKVARGEESHLDRLEKLKVSYNNVESGMKDLNKATADYINSLVPLNSLTKAAASMSSAMMGLVEQPRADKTAKAAADLNKDTASMASVIPGKPVEIPASVTSALEELKTFKEAQDAILKNSKANEEGLNKLKQQQAEKLAAKQEVLFGTASPAFKGMLEFGFKVSDSFQVLANNAIKTAESLARVAQKQRTTSFVEGVTGPNAAITRQKQDLDAQQRSIQLKELGVTRAQLTSLVKQVDTDIQQTLQDLKLPSVDSSSPNAAREGIRSMLTQKEDLSDKQKAGLEVLLRLQDQQLNKSQALNEVISKQRVLALSADEAWVQVAKEQNQVLDDQYKKQASIIEAKTTLLDISSRDLDLLSRAMPYLTDVLAAAKERVSLAKELNNLGKTELEVTKELEKQNGIINASKSTKAEKDAAEAQKLILERQLRSVGALQAGATLLSEQNLLLLKRASIQADQASKIANESSELEILNNWSEQTNLNATERLNILIKIGDKVADINRLEQQASQDRKSILLEDKARLSSIVAAHDTQDPDAPKPVLSREDAIVSLKRLGLEIDKEDAKIRLLGTKLVLEEERRVREEREGRMKSAEDTGTGIFSMSYLKDIGNATKQTFSDAQRQSKSIGQTFADSMGTAISSISDGLSSMISKNEFSWKGVANTVRSSFSKVFQDLAAQYMRMAITKSMTSVGGMFGFAKGGVMSPEGPVQPNKFANGGIMTEYGALKVNRYASGGVATSPQVAIYGEGRKHEAYVPLPDNRSIPVTLSGGSNGNNVTMGATTININIDKNGTSSTTTEAESASELGRKLNTQVKQAIHRELADQMRPGGLLFRG